MPKVRVIGSDGEQLGVMETRDAQRRAQDEGLDLVEISPNAEPPVCKIMDFGKFKYDQQKKAQANKKKQTVVQVKEVKLRPGTDKHDLDFKLKNAIKFLEAKDKVKITIQMRGREMAFKDRAREILLQVIEGLKEYGQPEQPPKMEGRTFSAILIPNK